MKYTGTLVIRKKYHKQMRLTIGNQAYLKWISRVSNFKEEPNEMLHSQRRFLCRWKYYLSENRSDIPWMFWSVVLEKDGDHLDLSCEKWRSVT